MHGVHIAQELVEKAREQGKVKKAVVEVGELANITPSDLNEHLKSLADFEIIMTEKKAKVSCTCGYEGVPEITERMHDMVLFQCPKCTQVPEVIEGDKIILVSVEIE